MYTNFFQVLSLPTNRFNGFYDLRLVLLSYLVAVFASYVALDLTGRLRDKSNSKMSGFLWLAGGSIAMGSGIWSMHFIGMLSFSIPGINLQYDFFWTAISLMVAIAASGFALFLLKKSIINVIHLIAGGLILGLAIASMHYTGMTGMLISLNISYLPGLFFLSILVAIVASEAAIWFALKSNAVVLKLRNRVKILSASIMGLAIFGMHYTGMAASIFTPLCIPVIFDVHQALDPTVLSITVAAVTFVILSIAFFASTYKESMNLKQFERARILGVAEISASVLHNVGNVLNSLNISLQTMTENLSSSPLKKLVKLSTLLTENKDNLSEFLTKENRGVYVVKYINELAETWDKEEKALINELKESNKNISIIKDIIATQQDVTRIKNIDQVVSINDLLDEVLFLCGIYLRKEIIIKKYYAQINPIFVDKIKLLQILTNLITNAKEALFESCKDKKKLIIETSVVNKDYISIKVSDNGLGIPTHNLDKIFIFGFTTKKEGHGYGLHATGLAINELGGEITVKSEGNEKGSEFTLYLPYRKTNPLGND